MSDSLLTDGLLGQGAIATVTAGLLSEGVSVSIRRIKLKGLLVIEAKLSGPLVIQPKP